MRHGHRAALGAIVAAVALLLILEGAALPTAWLPVEEAAALQRARGGGGTEMPSAGLLYPVLLAPAARSLSASESHRLAKVLSAVFWAVAAIPAYLLARRLVPPGAALAVAALSVAAPASVYATAAVPDALALLLAACALPLLARASERGSTRDLAGAVALAIAAAMTRPWLVVFPFALLAAYGVHRPRWRALLRWPRSLGLAALAGFAYLTLASISSDAAIAFTSPGATARAAVASLGVAAVGIGVVPWLLAGPAARPALGRPELALLAACVPALALAGGALGAADPARGLDERPLLVLAPLILALAAAAWLGGVVRMRAAASAGTLVVLAALALPALDRAPVQRAAGMSVISADGGSRAFLAAGSAAAVAVALLMLHILRRRPLLLPAALAVLLLVGQAAAWSSIRSEARALSAAQPADRGWIDGQVGPGAEVVVAGPAEALDPLAVARLTLGNRSVRGSQELDLSYIDPESGQLGVSPGAELVLVRGTELAGTEIARSEAGVLMRPEDPYRLGETIEGVFADGWSGARAVYRRFSRAPGTLRVSFGREGASGDAPSAEVVIESGRLDEDADELRARFELRPGEERAVEVEVPVDRYRVVVTLSPTFPAPDGRQLGAQLRFVYRPRQ